tara:strand:+ start:2085 stop:2963 length:879 start_codon:yes stop_codon:yes gene_type:complete
MANRSYLYSTNFMPGTPEWFNSKPLRSISEWPWEVPLSYKLLLCANPKAVLSSIWDGSEKTALVSDYKEGVKYLKAYLERLPEDAQPIITETLGFLNDPENMREYLILEASEIYDMESEGFEESNNKLLAELNVIRNNINTLDIPTVSTDGYDPEDNYVGIGLDNWSNILYFQFNDSLPYPDSFEPINAGLFFSISNFDTANRMNYLKLAEEFIASEGFINDFVSDFHGTNLDNLTIELYSTCLNCKISSGEYLSDLNARWKKWVSVNISEESVATLRVSYDDEMTELHDIF